MEINTEIERLQKYAIIEAELQRAKEKHPDYPKDMFRQLAILQEEAGEVTKAVLDYHYENDNLDHVKVEIIQTAAMCMRMLENLPKEKFVTERIKTFADALRETGMTNDECPDGLRPDETARRKIEIIAQALNEGWRPDWTDSSQPKWYPYFTFNGATLAGVRNSYAYHVPTRAHAYLGARLCYKTEELSNYAGEQFKEIYQELLIF